VKGRGKRRQERESRVQGKSEEAEGTVRKKREAMVKKQEFTN
jgi:hypothetical protein